MLIRPGVQCIVKAITIRLTCWHCVCYLRRSTWWSRTFRFLGINTKKTIFYLNNAQILNASTTPTEPRRSRSQHASPSQNMQYRYNNNNSWLRKFFRCCHIHAWRHAGACSCAAYPRMHEIKILLHVEKKKIHSNRVNFKKSYN